MSTRAPSFSTLALIVVTAVTTVAATRLIPEARAEGSATCQIMDWKALKPQKSMAEFQALVGLHGEASNTYVLPLTSGGATTGFMICSHN